jgi:hypothetical protein
MAESQRIATDGLTRAEFVEALTDASARAAVPELD